MSAKAIYRLTKRALAAAAKRLQEQMAAIDRQTQDMAAAVEALRQEEERLQALRTQLCRLREIIRPHYMPGVTTETARPADVQQIKALYLQVDRDSANDPYAARALLMLEMGINDAEGRLSEVQGRRRRTEVQAGRRAAEQKAAAQAQYRQVYREMDAELDRLRRALLAEYGPGDLSVLTRDVPLPQPDRSWPPFFCAEGTMPVPPDELPAFRAKMGPCLSERDGIWVPYLPRALNVVRTYGNSDEEAAMEGFRAYALALLVHMPRIQRRVTILDAVRKDEASLGALAPLSGEDGFCPPAPRTRAEVTAELNALWRLQEQKPEDRFVFLRGYPGQLDAQGQERVRQMMAVGMDRRLILFLVDGNGEVDRDPGGDKNRLSLLCKDGWLRMYIARDKTTAARFFPGVHAIHPRTVERLRADYRRPPVDTRYAARFAPEPYVRRYAPALTLPYGVDEEQRVHSLSFEGVDFAAYLMGASGAGKSMLYHTLLAGIVNRYHPDDVELWMADLGKTEFASYVEHPLPHIRYLIIDDTRDVILAFIKRMEKELISRQEACVQAGVQDYRQFCRKTRRPMPRILVMIDEFGVVDKLLSDGDFAESSIYRDMLTRLLREGRKMGFCFLFANQSYRNGVQGLREEARVNIGLRLAMMASKEEKDAVLAIPPALREADYEVKVAALKKYQVLYRSANELKLMGPVQTFYFTPEELEQRWALADQLMRRMRPVARLDADDAATWVDKHPVIKNCIQATPFLSRVADMCAVVSRWRRTPTAQKWDLLLFPGDPRDLRRVRHIALEEDKGANALLLACGEAEICPQASGAVIAACCHSARLQGVAFEVWAHRRSPFVGACSGYLSPDAFLVGEEDVAQRMKRLYEHIIRGEGEPRLVVVLEIDALLEQMQETLEEKRTQEAASLKADEDILARINRSIGAPGGGLAQSGTQDTSDPVEMFRQMLRLGPSRNGTHFLIAARGNEKLTGLHIHAKHFSATLAFRGGIDDTCAYDLRRAMRSVTGTRSFLAMTAAGSSLFAPYGLQGVGAVEWAGFPARTTGDRRERRS